MPDYIEREAALDALCKASVPCFSVTGKPILDVDYVPAINAIPAADVRPVVLCRDCKWCHAGYCEKYDDLIPWGVATGRPWEDWFCADGRKADV